MKPNLWTLSILLASCSAFAAQQVGSEPALVYYATQITHIGAADTVTVSDPRPLLRTIEAMNREYGMLVDYEEPVYEIPLESKVATTATGRSYPIPSGGSFTATYATIPTDWQMAAIDTLVNSYNATHNPGTFAVSTNAGDRIEVQGKSRSGHDSVSPLDMQVKMPVGRLPGETALQKLVDAINARSSVHVVIARTPMNLMMQQDVLFDGSTMEARRALRLIAGTMSPKLVWELQYDIESRQFYLSLLSVKVQRTLMTGG